MITQSFVANQPAPALVGTLKCGLPFAGNKVLTQTVLVDQPAPALVGTLKAGLLVAQTDMLFHVTLQLKLTSATLYFAEDICTLTTPHSRLLNLQVQPAVVQGMCGSLPHHNKCCLHNRAVGNVCLQFKQVLTPAPPPVKRLLQLPWMFGSLPQHWECWLNARSDVKILSQTEQ